MDEVMEYMNLYASGGAIEVELTLEDPEAAKKRLQPECSLLGRVRINGVEAVVKPISTGDHLIVLLLSTGRLRMAD
ncbi:hypothetical protein [Metabacillus arenae]|uniref:hypothetical protein n=1 Tax=Metabacillus arenae TaxID=2771434 RepID=UPI0029656436|nr:hypothetical protein [Metabacillus arenae]